MNLDDLMARGGFVPPALILKNVEWDGANEGPVNFDVYIKEPSAAAMERLGRSVRDTGDDAEGIARRPMMVALSIFFDAEGKQGFTYEQACNLKFSLCNVLYEAVAEVLEIGQAKAKNSQPPTSSGANSSSTESAAEQ